MNRTPMILFTKKEVRDDNDVVQSKVSVWRIDVFGWMGKINDE